MNDIQFGHIYENRHSGSFIVPLSIVKVGSIVESVVYSPVGDPSFEDMMYVSDFRRLYMKLQDYSAE